ncbi:nitroreductase [Paenibacillus sambharensis]|uniref:Nitroreductase n=1 Tax=Paenibacillus sambharensis TaxID=1803190 RepID=A0A2W1LNH5_9BACL|nr:nitroreductase family protein [Paenibacillus sambharensis]PZD96024.1 nitroreductase [Paenibacillus sambharensis]
MTNEFFKAIQNRRSIYSITSESPISDERIQEIVEEAVKYTPSSFNSQSSRAVVLLGAQHHKLWDLTTEVLKAIVPADQFESTQQKMDSFRAGHGTVLFFEEMRVVEGLQQQFPTYQDRFPVWAEHANAMLQLVIWTALEGEGLGASLQHYNPLIDDKVKAQWSLPESWKLIAQMPFGKPGAPAGDKDFQPVEERTKIFK